MPFIGVLSIDTLPAAIHFSAVRLEQMPELERSLLRRSSTGATAFPLTNFASIEVLTTAE
jgi:hypothetical protein